MTNDKPPGYRDAVLDGGRGLDHRPCGEGPGLFALTFGLTLADISVGTTE